MEDLNLVRWLLATFSVGALMLLLIWGLKKINIAKLSGGGKKYIKVLDSTPVDHKRRLILAECQGQRHLILIGGESDVVVQNYPKKTTFNRRVKTKGSEGAPKVVAKGKEWLAERIIEIAKEHDIYIKKDADLVEILEKIELDQEIPVEIYTVVAEIFSYLYNLNKEKK